ncbi:MAG: Asp-tRNA(Asn)/Glu-tRNA(Gln) amidotransferase subunit GatB [Candidatus Obscuribacterales bacterium]
MATEFEAVIGLEVHAQLKTKSKAFCGCPTEFGQGANDQVCPVCLGMPGVLPVLNRQAVELAIRAGIALNCEISRESRFDRKNYFYPDLAKGYQISQLDQPVCRAGYLAVGENKIRINRAHLEEDAGKLVHAGADGLHGSDYSLVDFNRAGVSLLEIVSEPDLQSAEEAKNYLTELRNILRYIDVCDGNLEEGSFRCDANVSIRERGAKELGTKTEIKNMNSFRSVQRAIDSEIERQRRCIEKGEKIVQETRLWDEGSQSTHPMRSKEEAHDYRYFPEPDLVPLAIERSWVDSIAAGLPELPAARRDRYQNEHGLKPEDAALIVESRDLSDFFDRALLQNAPAVAAANLLINVGIKYLKDNKLEISQTRLTPENLLDLVQAVESGKLSSTNAKVLLPVLMESGGSVAVLVEERGLVLVSDEGALKETIEKVLERSPEQLADFRSGKKPKLRQYFFGEVMKDTRGKANPQIINRLLDELL